MIRCSKHNINHITNQGKLASLDKLFIDYKHDLEIYVNYIIDGILPLKTNLSSKLLPTENLRHSRYKQLLYKQASEILRSQMDKAKKKRYNTFKRVYTYMMKNHPDSSFVQKRYSELNLKDIMLSKFFTIPNLNDISINLDERFFDIKQGNHFDNFVKIVLPYFNEKGPRALQIKVPLKQHSHSNELRDKGFALKNNIQLKKVNNEYYVTLIWHKVPMDKKQYGKTIGLDMGVNKLLTTSDGDIIGDDITFIYDKISRRKRGSKGFKRALSHRTNETNRLLNSMELSNVNTFVIEDLSNVKKDKSFNKQVAKGKVIKRTRKQQESINERNSRWLYPLVTSKLEMMSNEHGIMLVKVSPAYTSQMCSKCGTIHEESRKGEYFNCIDCGHNVDADVNASINIRNRGIYSFSDQEKDILQQNI